MSSMPIRMKKMGMESTIGFMFKVFCCLFAALIYEHDSKSFQRGVVSVANGGHGEFNVCICRFTRTGSGAGGRDKHHGHQQRDGILCMACRIGYCKCVGLCVWQETGAQRSVANLVYRTDYLPEPVLHHRL